MKDFYMPLAVNPDQLMESMVHNLSYEDLSKFVIDLDLMVADVSFTENLIAALVKSLEGNKEDVDLPFIDWEKVK